MGPNWKGGQVGFKSGTALRLVRCSARSCWKCKKRPIQSVALAYSLVRYILLLSEAQNLGLSLRFGLEEIPDAKQTVESGKRKAQGRVCWADVAGLFGKRWQRNNLIVSHLDLTDTHPRVGKECQAITVCTCCFL